MAQPINETTWDSFVITPCYQIYKANRNTTLVMLHALWEEYTDNYLATDVENRVQGWQGVMALVRIFRERKEWDEPTYGPHVLHSNMPEWKKRGLEPKTKEWMQHWISFPEEQQSMAKHARRQSKEANNEEA